MNADFFKKPLNACCTLIVGKQNGSHERVAKEIALKYGRKVVNVDAYHSALPDYAEFERSVFRSIDETAEPVIVVATYSGLGTTTADSNTLKLIARMQLTRMLLYKCVLNDADENQVASTDDALLLHFAQLNQAYWPESTCYGRAQQVLHWIERQWN